MLGNCWEFLAAIYFSTLFSYFRSMTSYSRHPTGEEEIDQLSARCASYVIVSVDCFGDKGIMGLRKDELLLCCQLSCGISK